ncbi:hypothetical protein KCV07_g98, partial [Aureobasidium melanogenum]
LEGANSGGAAVLLVMYDVKTGSSSRGRSVGSDNRPQLSIVLNVTSIIILLILCQKVLKSTIRRHSHENLRNSQSRPRRS